MHHKQRDRATSSVRKIDHYDRRPDDTATDGFYDDEQDVNDDDYDYMVHDCIVIKPMMMMMMNMVSSMTTMVCLTTLQLMESLIAPLTIICLLLLETFIICNPLLIGNNSAISRFLISSSIIFFIIGIILPQSLSIAFQDCGKSSPTPSSSSHCDHQDLDDCNRHHHDHNDDDHHHYHIVCSLSTPNVTCPLPQAARACTIHR